MPRRVSRADPAVRASPGFFEDWFTGDDLRARGAPFSDRQLARMRNGYRRSSRLRGDNGLLYPQGRRLPAKLIYGNDWRYGSMDGGARAAVIYNPNSKRIQELFL